MNQSAIPAATSNSTPAPAMITGLSVGSTLELSAP
jgi:hypothetical protein